MNLEPEENKFVESFQEDIDKIQTIEQFYEFFWKAFENDEVPLADWANNFGEIYSPIVRRVMIRIWYQKYGPQGFEILLSSPSQNTIEHVEDVMKNNITCRFYLGGERRAGLELHKKYGQFYEDTLCDSEMTIKLKNLDFDPFMGLSKKEAKKKHFADFPTLPEEKIRRGIVHTYTHRFSTALTEGLLDEIVEISMKSPYIFEVY